jgi:leucyl-tRNA synthetase
LEWSETGAEGAFRFLNRVWRIVYKWHDRLAGAEEPGGEISQSAKALRRKTHQTIARVTHDIGERLTFNTAIAGMMELTNEVYAYDGAISGEPSPVDRFVIGEALEALVRLLGPFTPHIAEELWEGLGHGEILISSEWPKSDPELAWPDELEIPVQLNGKLVAKVVVPADVSEDSLIAAVLENDRVKAKLDGRTIAKTIVVPKRLVNLVAR